MSKHPIHAGDKFIYKLGNEFEMVYTVTSIHSGDILMVRLPSGETQHYNAYVFESLISHNDWMYEPSQRIKVTLNEELFTL